MGQARQAAERFFELFSAGKMEDAIDLYAPGCITLMPTGALTQEEHLGVGYAFKSALPDAEMRIDQAVESGDEVVILGHFCGTHEGDLVSPGGTIPASGKPLNLRLMDYFKVEDGKIVDHQTLFDQMDMLGQLGALPG